VIQSSDVPRVAATIRVAGELFEVHGDLMLSLTSDWAAGAKAANLDPTTRGNQWDVDNECHVANDPTGEAAIRARADMAVELQGRLERIVADCQWLRDTAHVLAPIVPPSTMNDKDDLWCSHHLKIGLCEVRHAKDLCRYCYDFMALWQVRPPVSILRDRHHGKRITESMVKSALEADGVLLSTVGGVTRAVRQARGSRTPNQNQKRKKSA
jgi:hypothetical protein